MECAPQSTCMCSDRFQGRPMAFTLTHGTTQITLLTQPRQTYWNVFCVNCLRLHTTLSSLSRLQQQAQTSQMSFPTFCFASMWPDVWVELYACVFAWAIWKLYCCCTCDALADDRETYRRSGAHCTVILVQIWN